MSKYALISEETRKKYINALYNCQDGNYFAMKNFQSEYPNEYSFMNAQFRQRSKIIDCVDAIYHSGNVPYFGALTFDDKHDKSSEENKRKQAIRLLNLVFVAWVMVEEYGEENGRYHIHFIGCFRYNKTMSDFHNEWHSHSQIERVKNARKTARYLTNYMEKQVPRIRKSKSMVEMVNISKRMKKNVNYGFKSCNKPLQIDIKSIALDLPF